MAKDSVKKTLVSEAKRHDFTDLRSIVQGSIFCFVLEPINCTLQWVEAPVGEYSTGTEVIRNWRWKGLH